MKIIVSPDSFKGSCSAIEVADSIEKAIHSVDRAVEVVKIPVAEEPAPAVEIPSADMPAAEDIPAVEIPVAEARALSFWVTQTMEA